MTYIYIYVFILSLWALFLLRERLKKNNIYYYIYEKDHEGLANFIRMNPNSVNKKSRFNTPLQSAILYGDLAMIRLLLDNGADPNQKTSDGESAVHTAGYKGDLQILKLLSEYKANFNQETSYNLEFVRELKPFYELQYLSPEYLLENKEKVEEQISFYKDNLKKSGVDLGLMSWMLDYDKLIINAEKMHETKKVS